MCVTHITEYRSADETRLWGHAHSMALAVSELVWPRPHTVKQDFIQIGKHTRIPVMIYNDIRSQRRHSRKIPMSILKKLSSCDYFGILNWICLFNIFLPRLQQLSLMLTLRKPHIKHPCFKNKFIIDLARVWCYVNSCAAYNVILVLHVPYAWGKTCQRLIFRVILINGKLNRVPGVAGQPLCITFLIPVIY